MAGALLTLLWTGGSPVRTQGTGPGGVAGSALWVKADVGLQVNGSQQVTEWLDQSGSGNTASELRAATPAHNSAITATAAITRVANGINFNPAVDFTGATGRSLKGNGTADWNAAPLTIFAVALREGATNYGGVFTANGNFTTDVAGDAGIGLVATAGNNYALDGTGCTVAQTPATLEPLVVRAIYTSGANANGGSTWLNGVQDATGTSCATAATTFFEVGGRTAGSATYDGRIFNGKIAEVVAFRSAVSAANANNIESYLALKYGITLRQTPSAKNYTDSGSAIVWDATANATYNNNIAGIGRDDTAGLVQRQSKSVNAGEIVTIGLGTIAPDNASNPNNFAADKTFLTWGRDTGVPILTTPVPGSSPSLTRLQSVWKTQATTNVGLVTVSIPVSALPGTQPMLLIGDDATFDGTDAILPLTLNGANYERIILLGDEEYFTFGSIPPPSPGGVVGSSLWLKANAGVTPVGANASAWADQSGNSANASQATAANRPVIQSNAVNFNPGLLFDGTDDFLSIASGLGISGTNPLSMIGAGRHEDNVGWDAFLSQPGGQHYDYIFGYGPGSRVGLGSTNAGGAAGFGSVASSTVHPLNVPGLATVVRGNGGANVFEFYGDGGLETSITNALVLGTDTTRVGGRVTTNGDTFDGTKTEIITYSRTLTANELQRVHSYLAIKYGITMPQTTPLDYLASDGSVTWNAATNAPYNKNIAGIGRDDQSVLVQRQSRSVNSDEIVTIGLGTIAVDNVSNPNTFTTDKTFLTWGSDGGAPTLTLPVSGTGLTRLQRIWKTQETLETGTVLVRVPASVLPGGTPTLLRSLDATFDGTDTQIPLVLNGANYEAPIDFASGDFFTFGSIPGAAPGGVAAGLVAWQKANDGISTNALWEDSSSANNDAAQGTVGAQPILRTGSAAEAINFNPVFDFDGVNDNFNYTSPLGIGGTADSTTLIAHRQDANTQAVLLGDPDTGNNQFILLWNPGGFFASGVGGGPATCNYTTTTASPVGFAGIGSALRSNSTMTVALNGGGAASGACATAFTSEPRRLGSRTAEFANGAISEFIEYNRALSATELLRAQSYLAIKYGVVLNQTTPLNYLASDASVIWDATANATYKNSIAGIGRDDASALIQRQSKHSTPAATLVIGLGGIAPDNASNPTNFAADKSFMVWGADAGSLTQLVAVPATTLTRLGRVWKVQETGTVGDVVVRIRSTILAGATPSLISSTDPTFSSGNTIVPMTLNGIDYESALTNFTNGEFFTFASVLALPGGVGGSALWLRADVGVNCAADGCTATQWLDQSGNAKHANTPTGTPSWAANTVDFNPAMRFDANDKLSGASLLGTGTYTNGNVYIVSKKNTAPSGGSDADFYEVNGQGNGQGGLGVIQPWGDNLTYWDAGDNTNGSARRLIAPAGTITLGKYELKSYNASTTLAQTIAGVRQAITLNGKVILSDTTMASYPGVGNPYYVGGYATAAAQSEDIAELVVFTSPINAVQHQSIQSYLAIKYGISIDQTVATSYRASDINTIPWPAVGNPYKNNITGIGRDDGTALNHKQSSSINTANNGNLITMGLGSIAVDDASNPNTFPVNLSFLVWSDDNASTFLTTSVTGGSIAAGTKRMTRIWRAHETGTVGTVQVRIPASALPGTNPVLIRSTDTTFTGTDTIVPLVLNGSSYEATTDFVNNELFTFAALPPAAPGGIGGGLALWLKANAGTTVNGSNNFTGAGWLDQSGNNRNANTIVSDPQLIANAINFNPTVRFDGNDYMRFAASPFVTSFTAGEVFSVPKSNQAAATTSGHIFDFGGGYNSHYVWSNDAVYDEFGTSTRLAWNPVTKAIVEDKAGTISTITGPAVNPRLYSIYATRSQTGNWGIAYNGANVASTASHTVNFTLTGANETVGSLGVSPWNGETPEIFLYNRVLTATERQQVSSYLAVKYGITQLSPANGAQDYLSSLAAVTWNGVANAAYHTNVAGIARDDASALDQRQSASYHPGDIVTIGLGTIAVDNVSNPNAFTADQSYLIWGRNTGALSQTVAIAATNVNRMARIWRAQESGTGVANVVVRVPVSSLSGTQPVLIRSTDATFTDTDTFVPMVQNGANYEATTDFTGVEFFTFGSVLSKPGGVGGEALWLRADVGMDCTTDNCTATAWDDQSGSGRDATGTAGTLSRKNLGVNFNPTLAFDAGDGMRGPSLLGTSTVNNANVYIVSKKVTAGTSTDFLEYFNTAGTLHLAVHQPFTDNVAYWDAGSADANGRLTAPAGTIVLGQYELKTYNASTTAGQTLAGAIRQGISKNGKLLTSDTTLVAFTGMNAPYQLGGISQLSTGGANTPDGAEDFAEVIVYTTPITAAQQQAIESYLAIKYGITLDQTTARNYVDSSAAVLWNATTNSGYKTNIAGIGRDDVSGLLQKQSKSINAGEFVTIGLGTIALDNVSNPNAFAADRNFMIWGHDNASQVWGLAISGSTLRRMPRVWKVQETGTVGSVVVQIPRTILGGISPTLFRSTDATFDNTDTQLPMVVNGSFLEATIDFGSGDFFTFASEDGPAVRQYGDGYLTDGIIKGAIPGAITPTCYPTQFWEHVPIEQKGVFTGGNGGFMHGGFTASESTILADVNNDGKLDILAIFENTGVWAWLGNGDGTFQTAAIADLGTWIGAAGGGDANSSTHVGDVNGDGSVDIAFFYDGLGNGANDGTWVWLGNGDGTFQHTPIVNPAMSGGPLFTFFPAGGFTVSESTDLVDVNNDGKLDIVWAYDNGSPTVANNGTWVWLGNGNGTWQATPIETHNMAGGAGFTFTVAGGATQNESTHLVDIDKDGLIDLVWIYNGTAVANSGVRWWKGNGNGTFQQTVNEDYGFAGGPGLTFGLEGGQTGGETTRIVDVNRDGNLDILWIWDGGADPALSGTYVYLGNGNGTFNHTPTLDVGAFSNTSMLGAAYIQAGYSPSESTLVGDLNGDTVPDILWTSELNGVANSGTLVWLGKDSEKDGLADIVDPDDDNDGILDASDTCDSPGSISPSMQLWLKADEGTTVNASNNFIHWADQTAASRDANLVLGDPQKVEAGINFNPTVVLDGNDYFRFAKSPFVTGYTAGEVFVVQKSTQAAATSNAQSFDFGNGNRNSHYTWTDNAVYEGFGTTDRLGFNSVTKAIVDAKTGVASITGPAVDPKTYHLFSAHSAANDWGVSFDGTAAATTATNAVSFALAAGNEHVGAVSGLIFTGEIAEVILYNRTLTASERQQVQSYLGTKYGITIGHSYLASDDTTIYWDMAANATYHNDVAGIGLDDGATLNQKQSKSINADNIVSIGLNTIEATNQLNTNTFAADKTFMVWGNDDGPVAPTFLVPGTTPKLTRLGRVWKVQETLTVGVVTVRVPQSALAGTSPTMIRSTDATFDSTDELLPMTINGSDYEVTIDYANGDFFTFAAFLPSPGGVAGSALWLRADRDTSSTVDGDPLTAWNDQSASANHAAQATAANQPLFADNAADKLNFNPAVKLDGSNDFMTLDVAKLPAGTSARTLVGVGNLATIGSADAMIAWSGPVAVGTAMALAQSGTGAAHWVAYQDDLASTGFWQPNVTNEMVGTWAGGAGGAANLYGKMKLLTGPTAKSWNTNTTNGARVGADTWGANLWYWSGRLGDVIVYPRALNAAERRQVSSYLAIKYGYTLEETAAGSGYVNSTGAVIWDGVGNPTYHNAVAGIMNDTASALDQRVSQSIVLGDQIAIAAGAFDFSGLIGAQSPTETIGDESSLVWGHNNGSTVINIAVTDGNALAAGVEARMARIWRDQLTGTGVPGQLSIRIPATLVETGNPTLRIPMLLISPDPTFATGTRVVPIANVGSYYTATFTTFSATEQYFTIAGATSSVVLSKAFAPTPLAIGGVTRLTLALTNQSPVIQSGLTFTDTLPSGLIVATPANEITTCSPGAVNVSGSVVSLAGGEVGASLTCTVEVDVTTAPSVTSPVTCPAASVTNGAGNITGLSTNLSLVSGFGACVDVVLSADVQIVKAAPATFVAGETVAYTLTVTNNGPSPASGVTVSDVLPAQLTFVAAGSTPSCSAVGQTVTCNLGTLTSGQVVPITMNVQVSSTLPGGTVVNNTASVTMTTPDPNAANNSSTVASPPTSGSADLSIVKSTLEPSVTPGATFTYRLVITNNGPSTASNVTAADSLPSQVTFVTSPQGCTVTGQDVSCGPVPTLAPSVSTTFDIVVRLDPAFTGVSADISNVATTTSDTTDPAPANNTSAAVLAPTINPPSADIAATKTAVEPSVTPGELFTYRITVTNNGPSTAVDVGLTDTLPVELAFVSSPSGCSAAGQVVTCAPVGTLAPTTSTTLDIVVRLDPAYTGSGAGITNTATASTTTSDPNLANNTTNAAPLPTVNAPRADMQIVKSLNDPTGIVPGETYSYTLAVQNNGPSFAQGVSVTDPLPPFVVFQSGSAGCTWNPAPVGAVPGAGGTVTCVSAVNPTTIGVPESFTVTVQLHPSYAGSGADQTNSATVSATTTDPTPGNNTSPAGAPPVGAGEADIALVKTTSAAPVSPGETFTYTLLVSNQGPSAASDVVVTDTLPAGVTFQSGADCVAVGQDVTCTVPSPGSLAPGQSRSFVLTVLLDPSFAGVCNDILNTATASSSTTDPIPGNNQNPAPGVCPPLAGNEADVAITKVASAAPVVPGTTFTYTVTVTNAGPSVAQNVAATDTLPAQLTFVSSPSGCTAVGQNVTCPTIPTLALSTPTSFDLVVRLDPSYLGTGADILNTATVATGSLDPNTPNNTSAASSPTVAAPSADVSLAKAVSAAPVVPGGTFTYTVSVSNAGPSTATNIQITDTLPAGVTFVSSASGCTAAAGTVSCGPVASLLPGAAPAVFQFVVRLDPGYTGDGSDLGNVATATPSTPDPDPTNNSNIPVFPTLAAASADVSITKTAVEPSVVPGNTFSYTIVVSNAGPSVAADAGVTDTLPANLSFVSSTAGCTAVGQDVTCPAIPTIAVGGSSTFTLVVRLDPAYTGNGSDLGNVAVVTPATADPNTPNNTSASAASPTVLAPSADVRIVKSVSDASVAPGQNYTYTLTVTNAGPSNATAITATDTLPSQVAFVSSLDGCTATGQSVTCPTVASLGVGASATFTFTVQLDPSYAGTGADILNSSLVTAATADPAMANNTSPAGAPPVGPGQADLAITKDVSAAPVTPGTDFSYTLTVSNLGPSDAGAVEVSDTLPANVTFVSSPDGCTATGQDVTCTIPTLAAGASTTFTLVVHLDAGYAGNGSDIPNTAQVTSPITDPVPANNTSNPATPVIGAASADLSIVKSVFGPQAVPGENFTYRIVVSNAGPSTALGVQVSDTLPAQTTFVSTPSGCTLTGTTITCPPVGSLAVGATATYDIVVKLDPAYTGTGSDVINSATVNASTPDPASANNTVNFPLPSVGTGNADVFISKGVVEASVIPGQNFTYRITVANAGPANAAGIVVTDTLPSQVTFVSSPDGCTAGTPVTCPAIANLGVGASATRDIVVKLDPSYVGDGSNVLNTATATPATNDSNLANNTASSVPLPAGFVGAASADLSIVKQALDATVVPGATFTYRITVSNAGPSTAANATVTDTLPLPLAFVSSASGCAAIGQDVTCSSSSAILPGGNTVFELVVRLDAAYAGNGSDLGNIATVSSSTADPQLANNTSAVAPPPAVQPPTADLTLTKTAVEPSVTPGQTFSYNIVVGNNGPSVATDIVISDSLPVGLTFVSSGAGCTAVGQDVTCPAIATLAPGATSSVTLVVRLDPAYTGNGSDLDNVATAHGPTDPTDPVTPPTPPPTINAPSADVRIVKSVSAAAVAPGQTFTYTMTITNSGPSTATSVVVTDTLPTQTIFVSSAEACTAVGQSVTCPTIASLAPATSATFTVLVQLDPSYVGTGGDVLNSSIVSAATADPAMANNTSPAGAPPVGPGQADLAITKDVSTAPVTPGTTFSYTLTVSNQGPSDASAVEVTDTLPPGVTFLSSPDGCTAVGQDVTCTLPTLAAGASATFTLGVQLDSNYGTSGPGDGSDIPNTASVTSTTTDPTLPNNTSNPATPVIGTASADLSIAKSVIGTPVPGGTFIYRLVVSNNGPSTALGVQVTDPLPAQVAFVSSPTFCNASGQTVTCPPIGSLAVGASVTFDLIVRLDPSYSGTGSDVINTATVTSTTPDPTPGNNTTPGVPLPGVGGANADVSITKVVVEPVVTPGATFTYRLTVANAGPATAANVQVIDTLPSQVTFVSSADGCTALASAVTCPAIPALFPGGTATFDLVVQLDPSYVGTGSNVLNSASANGTTADPVPANNTVTAVAPPNVGPPTAELTLTKQALEPSVTPGLTFTYRIVVGNTGPSTATSVVVTDPLPAPLAFVSSVSGCTAAGQLVTCPMVATLLPGATFTFEFVVRLDPAYTGDGSDLGNTATATSPTDPTGPTTPPAPPPTVNPPSADVQMMKSVSAAAVAPGQSFTYTLTITNHGPSNAVNVAVSDGLPIQTTFVSSAAGCTAVGQSVSCPAIASLGVGATHTFDLVVQLDPSYVGNGSDVLNVAIALAATADPFMANNSSPLGAAPVGGPNADLAIVKDVSTEPVTPGTNFFYRLTVANQGPSTATNVVISDPLPVGVTFVSSPEGCTAVGQNVTCPSIASLVPGQSASVVLVVQLDASYVGNGNDIQNVASVSSTATDPVPGNNMSNPATPVIGTPDADVAITKSVVEPVVAPGGVFTYRLVVNNVGPSTALGVVVTDPLPTQVSFVSSPQGCSAIGQLVTCPPLGSLAVGASVTFDLRVQLDPDYSGDGSDVVNIATSTASTRDPVPSNGTSAPVVLAVLPTGVDLAVTLTAAPLDTVVGDIVTFTATVHNPGPEAATGLTVSLPLPSEFSFEGVTASAGGYAASTGVWTIGTLPVGSTATMQVQTRVMARGTPTVTVTTLHVDQIERNPANNSASVAAYLTGWSAFNVDLVVTGTTTPPVVAAGGLFALELTAVNRGPTYAVDLYLTGDVPAGTTFASVTTSPGAVCTAPAVGATGTVRCEWPGVTFVDPGAKRTMAVGVRVDAGVAPGSSLTSTFRVSSDNPEYYEPSNQVTLTTAVADGSGAADLTLSAIMQSDGQTGTALATPLGVSTPMRFTVRNNGPAATVGARYAIEIPPPDLGMLQIRGATWSQGTVALVGISAAEWTIGPLAPGATATFDLGVAMMDMRATSITMRRVGSLPADLTNANDRATLILDGTGHPDAGERFTAIGNLDGVGRKELLTGAGRLETPQVRIYDGTGADTGMHFYAYSRQFVGGVRVAACDVDRDGIDEIVTAPGIGPGPHVRVFKVQNQVVREIVGFYAFDPNFPGGVYVSCADVDADGRPEVVASMGESGSEVRVFEVARDFVVQKAAFTAYEAGFLGGVRVATLNTTEAGGGQYQIVTVNGPGRPLEVRTWAYAGGTVSLVRSIRLTGPEYQLGAFIDVADINGDGLTEAVLSTDRGIPALIGILTLDTTQFQGIFQAYPSSFLGGTRVTLGDVDNNGQLELLISQGYGGRPIVDAYTLTGGNASFVLRLHPIEIP